MFCDLYILWVPRAESVTDCDEQIMEKSPSEVQILLFADNSWLYCISLHFNATTKILYNVGPLHYCVSCKMLKSKFDVNILQTRQTFHK